MVQSPVPKFIPEVEVIDVPNEPDKFVSTLENSGVFFNNNSINSNDDWLEEGTKSDEFNFKRFDFWNGSYLNARILKIWEDVNVLEDKLLSKTSKN